MAEGNTQEGDSPAEFISEPIRVEYDRDRLGPTSFEWRGTRYDVAEVLQAWQDWSVPDYAHIKGWIHRRHRNYYVVRTTDEQVFEMYLDRPPGRREWVLLKKRI